MEMIPTTIGVDAHSHVRVAAAVDPQGRVLAQHVITTGIQELDDFLAWDGPFVAARQPWPRTDPEVRRRQAEHLPRSPRSSATGTAVQCNLPLAACPQQLRMRWSVPYRTSGDALGPDWFNLALLLRRFRAATSQGWPLVLRRRERRPLCLGRRPPCPRVSATTR